MAFQSSNSSVDYRKSCCLILSFDPVTLKAKELKIVHPNSIHIRPQRHLYANDHKRGKGTSTDERPVMAIIFFSLLFSLLLLSLPRPGTRLITCNHRENHHFFLLLSVFCMCARSSSSLFLESRMPRAAPSS